MSKKKSLPSLSAIELHWVDKSGFVVGEGDPHNPHHGQHYQYAQEDSTESVASDKPAQSVVNHRTGRLIEQHARQQQQKAKGYNARNRECSRFSEKWPDRCMHKCWLSTGWLHLGSAPWRCHPGQL